MLVAYNVGGWHLWCDIIEMKWYAVIYLPGRDGRLSWPRWVSLCYIVWAVVDGVTGSSNGLRDMQQMKPLVQMVFYCVDKIKRLKLSKEVGLSTFFALFINILCCISYWYCVCIQWVTFIHFCQSPLWVYSTKHRHHSPEWMILSHVNCFIQGEVQWFQVRPVKISASKLLLGLTVNATASDVSQSSTFGCQCV